MRRLTLVLLGLTVLVVGLAAANLGRDPQGYSIDWRIMKPPPREVVLEIPGRGTIFETITASGTVEPVVEAEIAPQIVGRVVSVHVQDGDRVQEGDLLVKLDETEAKARLDSALARLDLLKSSIRRAEAELEKTRRDLERTERLAGRNASSASELADSRTFYLQAQAALEMARNELSESDAMRRTSQQALEYTEIRAPIDGIVCGCDVEVGEVVIAGTTNLPGALLMTIAQMDRMQVRADVDETDVPLVRTGQAARAYLQYDLLTAIPGTVERVAPKGVLVDEVVTFETILRIEGGTDTPLRPGMTATVEIEVRSAEDVPSVPVQAVVHRRRKDLPDTEAVRSWSDRNPLAPGEKAREAEARYVKIVFVAENGVARARPVEIGISDERLVEIRSGIDPDDRVIVGPFRALDELKDGDPVIEAADDLEALIQ